MKNTPLRHIWLVWLLALVRILPAQAQADSLLQLAASTPYDTASAIAYGEAAWVLKYQFQDSAMNLCRTGLAIAETTGSKSTIAELDSKLGVMHWIAGRFDSAEHYLVQSRDLYREINLDRGVVVATINLGLVVQNIGAYDRSIAYFQEGIEALQQNMDSAFLASAYTNMGNTYFYMEDYLQAIRVYKRAVAIKEALPGHMVVYKTYMNLGIMYQRTDNIDSSYMYYFKAIEGAKEQNDWKSLALSYLNIGTVYHQEGDLEEAGAYYHKSLQVFDSEYDNDYDRSILYSSMAQYYLDVNQPDSARQVIETNLEIGERLNNAHVRRDAFEKLNLYYVAVGDYRRAHAALQDFVTLKDSIFNIEKAETIEEMETRFETKQKDQQIAFLNQENALQTASLQRNSLLIGGLLLLLALVVIIFYFLRYRSRQQHQRVLQAQKIRMREVQMKAVIDSQEQERKRFATDLHDGMGQLISALQLNIRAINEKPKDAEQQNALYENSTQLLDDIHTEIRNIAFNLMPQTLMREGLVPAVQELLQRINRTGQIKVHLSEADMAVDFPDVVAVSLYRIIQELLSNLVKYSQATTVYLNLMGHDDELVITLEDDGMGFDLAKFQAGPGNGWRNIQTRLNLLKGSIEFDTQEGRKGTSVMVHVPRTDVGVAQRSTEEAFEA